MKSAEIKEMTPEELDRALDDGRRELFNLTMQSQTGQLENVNQIRFVRRDIARLLTEQQSRKQQVQVN